MPNWCNNIIYLKNEDKYQLDRAERALKRGEFMTEFLPTPEGVDSYRWQLENWGTKWDIEADYVSYEGDILVAKYASAWTPPIVFYNHLLKLGFIVRCLYYEPMEKFCGILDNGEDERYDLTDLDIIPEELEDEFFI